MKIGYVISFPFLYLTISLLEDCLAKRSKDIYCGACLALIDEVTWDISQVDPKKKIQIGSFRIDSKGNQALQEIPLARSAVHLTEVLEGVCNQMTNYASSTNADGHRSYVRTNSRDGSAVSLTNIEITGEVHSQLKFACESLIEDHEDDLIPAFQSGLDDLPELICVDLMDVCSKINITDFVDANRAVRTNPTKAADVTDDVEEEEDEEEESKDEL